MDKRGWLLVASLTVVGCGGADGGPIATQPDPTPEAVTAVDSGVDTKADIAAARDAGADAQASDVATDSGHAEQDNDADSAVVTVDAAPTASPDACVAIDRDIVCGSIKRGYISCGIIQNACGLTTDCGAASVVCPRCDATTGNQIAAGTVMDGSATVDGCCNGATESQCGCLVPGSTICN